MLPDFFPCSILYSFFDLYISCFYLFCGEDSFFFVKSLWYSVCFLYLDRYLLFKGRGVFYYELLKIFSVIWSWFLSFLYSYYSELWSFHIVSYFLDVFGRILLHLTFFFWLRYPYILLCLNSWVSLFHLLYSFSEAWLWDSCVSS